MTSGAARWIPALAATATLAAFAGSLFVWDAAPIRAFAYVDFFDYHLAADAVAAGADPYDGPRAEALARMEGVPRIPHSPYLYPAWFATVLVPLSLLPPWWAAAVWTLLSIAALVWTVKDAVARLGLPRPAWAAAVLFPPTLFTVFVGQVNLFLLALLWVAWSRRTERPHLAGAALGLAVGVKLGPILLALPLLAARRYRVLLAAGATGLTCLVVGELAAPGSTLAFATRVLPAATHVDPLHAHPVNQGLLGLCLRLFVANPWTVPLVDSPAIAAWGFRLSSAALCLALAVLALRHGRTRERETWSFALGTAIAVTPVAWESLFVLALLPAALLWGARCRLALAAFGLAVVVQRALDNFANQPDSHDLLRRIAPLSSVGLAGLLVLLATAAAAALRGGERDTE